MITASLSPNPKQEGYRFHVIYRYLRNLRRKAWICRQDTHARNHIFMTLKQGLYCVEHVGPIYPTTFPLAQDQSLGKLSLLHVAGLKSRVKVGHGAFPHIHASLHRFLCPSSIPSENCIPRASRFFKIPFGFLLYRPIYINSMTNRND